MQIERRLYPRLKIALPIEITMPDGEIITAPSINISMGGIQLECGQKDASQLFSASEEKEQGKPIELKVKLNMPIEPISPTEINLLCRIIISRRLDANLYQIGLKYLNLSNENKQCLETYIQKLIKTQ